VKNLVRSPVTKRGVAPIEVLDEDDITSEAMEIRHIMLNSENYRKPDETGDQAKGRPGIAGQTGVQNPAVVEEQVFKIDDNDPL
jgi:hypothetical protein